MAVTRELGQPCPGSSRWAGERQKSTNAVRVWVGSPACSSDMPSIRWRCSPNAAPTAAATSASLDSGAPDGGLFGAAAQAAYTVARLAAAEALTSGTYNTIAGADSFGAINGAFPAR
jgi:hypothetical protein